MSFRPACTVLVVAILLFLGCAGNEKPLLPPGSVDQEHPLAVFPVNNISSSRAPLNDIQAMAMSFLREAGITLVDQGVVDAFIERHRLRYLGGIDEKTAQALRRETGAGAVLILSLELFSAGIPPGMVAQDGLTPTMGRAFSSIPKIALSARLVSTGESPSVLWVQGTGLSGDQAPGILDLSLVTDPMLLAENAVEKLFHSLITVLNDNRYPSEESPRKIFAPVSVYLSPIFAPEATYRVAVAPFYNVSERRYAGDMMTQHFLNHLKKMDTFTLVEPGLTRDTFLKYRMIMDDGLSLANADIVFSKLNADLVLAGQIIEYEDYEGETGTPKVDFSALLIERQSREVVWSCESHNHGDEWVYFFEQGKAYTAYALASQMVQMAVESIGK